jgi:hypothetical protein
MTRLVTIAVCCFYQTRCRYYYGFLSCSLTKSKLMGRTGRIRRMSRKGSCDYMLDKLLLHLLCGVHMLVRKGSVKTPSVGLCGFVL